MKECCRICNETFTHFEEIAVLPCGEEHKFHFKCLKAMLKEDSKRVCPVCEVKFKVSNSRPTVST